MIATLLCLAEQVLLYLPLVCGGYISFSLLRIPNFSTEGAFVFGAYCAVTATALVPLLHPALLIIIAILSAMLGGALIGACMSAIATLGNIPYLLASIITLGLCHGLHVYVLGGSLKPLHGTNPLALDFMPMHPELLVLAGIGIVLLVLFKPFLKTQLGMCFAAYGDNPAFFKHHGIATNYVVASGILISNALAGLSGFLVAQSSGFIDMNGGAGLSLLCVTALMLGNLCKNVCTRSFSSCGLRPFDRLHTTPRWLRMEGRVSGLVPLFGMTLYCSVQQTLLMIGCNLKYFTALQACIVLCVMIYMRKNSGASDVHSDHLGV
jgi:putative ABC transport system permease protein